MFMMHWNIVVTLAFVSALPTPTTQSPITNDDERDPSFVKVREADIADYPWLLFLLTKTDEAVGACGASLLAGTWAITTAHCMVGVNSATVLGSDNYWVDMMLGREGVQIPVEWYTVHPSYDPSTGDMQHDLAILKLKQLANVTETLTPIQLPFPSQLVGPLENKKVEVTGWGASKGYSNLLSSRLQSTKLKVLPHGHCAAVYGATVDSPAVMCAAEEGSGSGICRGDSGVAVSLQRGSKVILVGVAEFRDSSCSQAAPSGFVRVDAHLPWITSVTGIDE